MAEMAHQDVGKAMLSMLLPHMMATVWSEWYPSRSLEMVVDSCDDYEIGIGGVSVKYWSGFCVKGFV